MLWFDVNTWPKQLVTSAVCFCKHHCLKIFFLVVESQCHDTNNWAPSPVLVVDDHIYQCAQCSGELRWIWRQFLSWWAASLPFDLFASFLPGLQFFLPMMITFTLLQTDVLFHLLQGPVLSCLRLQEEGAMSEDDKLIGSRVRRTKHWSVKNT